MTASPHPGPAGPAGSGPLDSTAQLMNQISTRLSARLGRLGPGTARRPPTLVAVAHGSRDPRALRTVTALLDRVRALRPDLPVRLGHIEIDRPLLPETLAGLRGEAVLVPLLLSRGYHVKHDLPAMAAAALAADRPARAAAPAGATGPAGATAPRPAAVPGARSPGARLTLRTARPLGPHPLLAEALHARLVEAGWRTPAAAGAGVVLAAAGSRDPDSALDTARTAALLSRRLGGIPVLPGYAGGAGPTVDGAVRALGAHGRPRPAVASCFVAPGRFSAQCAAAAPGVAADPLGDHPALARLVLHRYTEALATAPIAPEAVTVAV
ncbi:sirohydrochlorin chelatase [Streptomyces sp. NPDC018031]|uniref:sirohydrochlorin chelatase n=1 Tax=Streptomyces sp. NPDC018031 TaxID=3365033 RepID=UPI00378F7B5C